MPRGRIPSHGSPVERYRKRLTETLSNVERRRLSTIGMASIVRALINDFDRIFRSHTPLVIQQHIDQYCYQDTTVCPICGKPLLQRKGKYGDFLGCSDYPNCHGSRKMDGSPSLNNALKEHLDKRRKEAGQSSSSNTNRFSRLEL